MRRRETAVLAQVEEPISCPLPRASLLGRGLILTSHQWITLNLREPLGGGVNRSSASTLRFASFRAAVVASLREEKLPSTHPVWHPQQVCLDSIIIYGQCQVPFAC